MDNIDLTFLYLATMALRFMLMTLAIVFGSLWVVLMLADLQRLLNQYKRERMKWRR